jgi:hypothetical protein
MAYTQEQIAQYLRNAGFPEEAIPTMLRIAQLESSNDPNAFNPDSETKDLSYGLFQINMFEKMGPERRKWFGIKSNEELYDPQKNADAAYKLWNSRERSKGKGQGFTHWSTYNNQLAGNPNLRILGTEGAGMEASGVVGNPTGQASITNDIIARALMVDPELAAIYKKYLGKQGPEVEAALQTDLRNSKWWKKTGEQARAAMLTSLKKDQPSYNELKTQKINIIKRASTKLGGNLDTNAVDNLATKSLLLGWTDEQIENAILDSVKFSPDYIRGQAGEISQRIYNGIRNLGFTVDTAGPEFKNYVTDVIKGFRSEADILGTFRNMASQMYPQYADRFKAGASLVDVAQPLMYQVAQSLGLQYNDELLNDPVVQDGLQKNLTAFDVKREVRKDKRWQSSEEGWETILTAFDSFANTAGFQGGILA